MDHRYRVVLAAMLFAILFPIAAAAAPQTNPSCWTQEQCCGSSGCSEATVSFEADNDHCGSGWGRCYPTKPIDIEIDIPGLSTPQKVTALSEYLRVVYVFAVRFAAVLAVIVIMVAGIAWMTSADSGRLQQAKQWMGNAVLGLLLAVGSYVILQTINPDLVALQLPRPYMIRTIVIGASQCSKLPPSAEIRLGPDPTNTLVTDRTQLTCGQVFYTTNATQSTCIGSACPKATQVCAPSDPSTSPCVEGAIGGSVTTDGQAYVTAMQMNLVCADGSMQDLGVLIGGTVETREEADQTQENTHQSYAIPRISYLDNIIRAAPCGPGGGSIPNLAQPQQFIKGFVLMGRVSGNGFDDWYPIARSSCDSASTRKINGSLAAASPSDFFSVSEMMSFMRGGQGASCSLVMSRQEFTDQLF